MPATRSSNTSGPRGLGQTALRPGTMAAVPHSSPRDLFDTPERALARLSPEGRRFSWLAPRDGVLNVWVGDARGRGAPRDGRPGPGRALLPLVARLAPHLYSQDQGGDENHHLMAVEVDGGRTRDLTPSRGCGRRADRGAPVDPRPRPGLDEPARPLGLRCLPPDPGHRTAAARRPQPGERHRLARRPGRAAAGRAGPDAGGRLRAAGARRRGRRVPGRRRVRQRGRRARVRLHARRLAAVGRQRARLRPERLVELDLADGSSASSTATTRPT